MNKESIKAEFIQLHFSKKHNSENWKVLERALGHKVSRKDVSSWLDFGVAYYPEDIAREEKWNRIFAA